MSRRSPDNEGDRTAAERSSPRVLLIIPTYCEAKTIGECLVSVFAAGLDCDIAVVDDRSPDGTAAIPTASPISFIPSNGI